MSHDISATIPQVHTINIHAYIELECPLIHTHIHTYIHTRIQRLKCDRA